MSAFCRHVTATIALLLAAACGGGSSAVRPPSPSPAPSASSANAAAPLEVHDPLGAPPPVPPVAPFQPPAPSVYTTANGMTVWLLERHTLPLVAVTAVIPTGSSSDPKGEAGLAAQAAEMLSEGAGKRDALEFARAVDDLGASFDAGASLDASHVHVRVVKRRFAEAMQLFGDAIVRPRWDATEWKRIHDLWLNDLKERASDPDAVAHVVASAVFFGTDHPYAHPVDGLASTAPRVQLPEAKRFWAQAWRPDRVTVVVVGDVTKAELDLQLDAAFGGWKSPSAPPLPIVTPPPPTRIAPVGALGGGAPAARARLVMVDRADAPQAVVRVIRPGVSAQDDRFPPLYRANIAVGGSFTSRLNADLRETHGWTYGASSRIIAPRGVGFVAAGASFVTEKTVDALGAMLADLDDFAHGGLTEEEAAKTRSQARSEVVQQYETVGETSAVLAHDAAMGLGPDYEARSSALSEGADRARLRDLAGTFFDRAGATIIVVGPRPKLEEALTKAGYGPIEYRDAEGALLGKRPPAR
jgi:zinc protease